ncbi:HAD family hydrolase [Lichenifustis flavocetrariae]|uniref:HAD family phosphatase n=1 Tax=Lichenifustis flavocetrariae TaxID=2949735 RepID=A0AA41YQ54_9HYPH|nr:HAD family phosphatase [Lichenifustis flavocetrariae]MCW6506486.1 HAD family phosphatase [Lichenifustis flavocetrariae]
MASSSPTIVVFDIGNVLIEWDPKHLYASVFPNRPGAMQWFLDTICTPAWNLEQDGGRTWADGVGTLVAQFPEWRAEIEAYDRRWHEMIPRTIEGTVGILERLKQAGTKVYAITNFSTEKYRESFARFTFLAWFDGVVVSGDERLLKPHAPIFALLCERYRLKASDCVFIDDNQDNVDGARRSGMAAIHFTGPADLRKALQSYGLPA